jgi:hypothetical protein
MATRIGTREELIVDLTAASAPGEPPRLLVVFRLGGFQEFTSEFGNRATTSLIRHIVGRLPAASGPSSFYYRPRKDERCGIIAGRLLEVERALCAAATDVSELVSSSGISLGFGTAVLPWEANNAVDALALADSRIVGIADGEPVFRSSADAPVPVPLLQAPE